MYINGTWLTNGDNDKIWLECSEITQNGYKSATSIGKIEKEED